MPVDILAHILQQREALAPFAPELHGIAEGCYWYATGKGGRSRVWAALDGQPALVFVTGAPYRITFTGAHNRVMQYAFCCCTGLQNTYINALPEGAGLLVVKLTCNGLHQLLQQPLPGGFQPLMHIGEIWGQDGVLLAKAVSRATSRQQQVKLLQQFFLARTNTQASANYLLQAAANVIKEQRGQLSVRALCERLRVNYKWLERNFKHYLGVTPKAYIRNLRFVYAYLYLQQQPGDLTGVALEAGYYDQNHFIKECRKFTGRVPSAVTASCHEHARE